MYTKQIARLIYLARMINKYADSYYKCPSARQDSWAHEYDDCREDHPLVWEAYCAQTGAYIKHDSNDCRA